MEIITQSIDTRKGTIDYICTELRKLVYLQPRQEGKINLSLDLTKPEDITVYKHEDEVGSWFSFSWNIGKKHYVYGNIPCDITKMVQDVERMYDDVTAKVREEAEKANFEDRCYKLYQLEWMMSHGYSLDDLYKVMLKYEQDMFDPNDFAYGDEGTMRIDESDLERAAMQARDIFLFEQGFGHSQIFACKEEFLDAEYQDAAYMKWLFETQVDEEANKLKALYRKYTGTDLCTSCDLKLHTLAGDLKVYRNMDPKYKGIKVTLKPCGLNDEVLVAVVENAEGLDIGIQTYADAENDEPTTNETLCRESVEAAAKAKAPLTKEELKPIIFDEWKKFTFCDGENISADEIDDVPQELLDEIAFRCDSLETDDITQNIRACLQYAKENGTRALIKEMDDCNIWRYIG
ncbi:MAG: hypothetical protein IJJ65_02985 [Butyrivibrio sp.]|nr:hypothetical protein [Butyrivibrio sp.]